jgi:hypothetical protein
MSIELVKAADEALLFAVYASTRADKWRSRDKPQQETFLRMQFNARSSMRRSFPTPITNHRANSQQAGHLIVVDPSDLLIE